MLVHDGVYSYYVVLSQLGVAGGCNHALLPRYVSFIPCLSGALAGAQHGCLCLPADWVSQLEQHPDYGKFSSAAVQQALGNDGGQQPQPAQGEAELVNTTLNMGRDGAVLLARLVAQLDRTA